MEIKLNMENLTEQERDTLMGLVEKANKQKVWKPDLYEGYYYIRFDGSIYEDVCNNHSIDEKVYAIGNCFRTREEAEFAVEKLKVIAELRRFAEEHNNKIDWKDSSQMKFILYYDHDIHCILTEGWKKVQFVCAVFSSKKIAQQAISAIGADRLKKYYFEMED